MKIAVIGAGALGLYFGGRLQQAGHDVQFLLRRDFENLTQNGLTVYSLKGDFHLNHIKALQNVRDMTPVDLILIGLKTTANKNFDQFLAPLMKNEGTAVLSLQNGLGNEEALAKLFGAENVLGGVAYIGINRDACGHVHHLATGFIKIGEFTGGISQRCKELACFFDLAQIPCAVSEDIKKVRWEKLVWNIPFNGLCTLTGKTTDILVADPEMSVVIKAIMDEIIRAGNSQLLTTPISESFADQMLAITKESVGSYKPSMMVDRINGQPLELDALFRFPIAAAAGKGIPMPRVELLCSLLSITEKVPAI